MFTMSVFMKPLMDLIPIWQCERNLSKILYNTNLDLKVKVTDLEFLC